MFKFDPREDKKKPHGCTNCVFLNDKGKGCRKCKFPSIDCNMRGADSWDGKILKPETCPWVEVDDEDRIYVEDSLPPYKAPNMHSEIEKRLEYLEKNAR